VCWICPALIEVATLGRAVTRTDELWSYFQIIHSGTKNSKHYMFDTLTTRLAFIQISEILFLWDGR